MVAVRTCDKCGARIEITESNGFKNINVVVSKRANVVYKVLCGECRKWIEQNTKR